MVKDTMYYDRLKSADLGPESKTILPLSTILGLIEILDLKKLTKFQGACSILIFCERRFGFGRDPTVFNFVLR